MNQIRKEFIFLRKLEDKRILNMVIFLIIVAQQTSKKLLGNLKTIIFYIFTCIFIIPN